jgi:hypothetical protein
MSEDHSISNEKKDKNKKKVIDSVLLQEMGIDKEALKKLQKKLLKAGTRPERGIETWFRLTSKNLYTRLTIVDTKTNILITSNAIIISVILGSLYPRLDEDPHLIFAVGGMVLTNVLSIAFAIIATLPKAASYNNKDEKVIDIMAFEDFHHIPLTEYNTLVTDTLESNEKLYPSMVADIYAMGNLLARKYKLIRISYLIFLYGIVLSVFAFAMCHLIF